MPCLNVFPMIPNGYLPDTYWYHEIFLIKNQNQQILCCVMSLVVGITGIGQPLPYTYYKWIYVLILVTCCTADSFLKTIGCKITKESDDTHSNSAIMKRTGIDGEQGNGELSQCASPLECCLRKPCVTDHS